MMALSCNQGGLLAWLLLLLSLTQVQTQCPTPVLPPHSSLRGGGDLEDTYPAGTNLPLRCISGYEYISGSVPRITCLATGKWTDLPTLCQGQRCPVPNIDNGNIVSTNDLRLGEQVTLGCEYGFRIIGGDTRLCVLKGGKVDWDREFPICQRIPCFRPPVIANGRYDPNPSDVYEAGSVIMYRCDPDYSLIGHSTITCVVAKNGVDGEWNRPSPECKTQCPTPVLPPHSSLRGGGDLVDTYPVGTNLQLQCISGYEYISGRVPRLTCLATGKWSDLPTLCQGQRCPVPNIDNGNIVSSNDLRLGEKVTLGCDYGFRIIGSDTRLCVWKGAKVDWDRELPICQRIPCVPPPVIANGRYDPTASGVYNVGSVVIYRCDADYSLIGKSAIICGVAKNGVDGEWNRPSPECKKVKCHRPHIPNGRVDSVFQATYTYQNKLLIGCNPGYSFIESSVIECDADNQWKPPGPWCDKLTDPTSTPPPNPSEEGKSEGVKCDRPNVENGKIVNSSKPSYAYNDSISFECNSGYSAVGSLHIKCGNNSLWVPAIPKCVKDNCTAPEPPPYSALKEEFPKEGYPVGTVLTYHCIIGYEYIPGTDSSIKCLNTSKWSEIQPLCRGKKCPIPRIENSNTSTYNEDDLRLGGTITISCLHGYRPVGEATLKCILKDGKVDWNKAFPICDLIACNRPDTIVNGHFDPDPKDEYYIGSVVIYRCKRDFSLIGNRALTCITTEDGRNGKWNLPTPECKNVKCDRPSVENGKLLNTFKPSYTYNDAISFECNSGYSAVGSLHIKCGANSSWVPAIPKCVKDNCTAPEPPPYSALKEEFPKEGYPVGTVLTYHCIIGYEYIPGTDSSIKCLNTSKWSEIQPLCRGKKCPIPRIENSNTSTYNEDDLRLGGTITISCLHGYRPVGEATLKCILKDGKVDWNKAFPICDLIACNRPDTIVNGHFDPDPKDEYYIGSVVIYRCKRDFSLIGNRALTCITTEDGRNGKWNLPTPECKNVKCDRPSVENGKLLNTFKPSYTYNDAISFECNSGYSAVGSLHIKCGANSSWVPAIPKCVKDNCTAPEPPPYSALKEEFPKEGYPVGTVLTYHCIIGYEYIPGTDSSIKCLNTSKWSEIQPLCRGKKCPIPRIENSNTSTYNEDDLRLGGTITISCLHGYRPVGEATLKCILKDGKVDWNKAFPICDLIACNRPDTIVNGHFDPDPKDEYYIGSVVIYRCKRDFSLIGNRALTCITTEDGRNGKWNLPTPECKNVKCDRPSVENGKLLNTFKPSYTYNDAISFECNSGYSAVGSLHIKCGANSSWVPAIPKCVKDNCTAPEPPPYSALKEEFPKEGYPVGTVLTYHCIIGYEYIPGTDSSIKCLNTSKWSEIQPLCRGKKCPIPRIENSNTSTYNEDDLRLGGTITISCLHGYRPVGEATLKCILKDGKVDWNKAFPICDLIACNRPDTIVNGHFDPDPKDEYYIGSVVIYRCKRDFSLIGNRALTCITTEDGRNGKWNLPTPECKNVKCDRPSVENGKLLNTFKPSYTYNDAISFECNSGYSAVGSLHIKCGANSSWVPAIPKCVKDNCTAPKPPSHSALKEEFPKEGYPVGTVLTYHCIIGYEYIPGRDSSIKCMNTSKWSEIQPLCRGKKCPIPHIENSNTSTYNDDDLRLGGTITISCLHGYRPVGEATLKCILKDGKVDWNRAFPVCDRNVDKPNPITDKPNTTTKDYAEYHKTTALGKLIILLAVLYNCW